MKKQRDTKKKEINSVRTTAKRENEETETETDIVKKRPKKR